MPNDPEQPAKLAATLALDETVQLSGQLSSLLDGRLQLETVLDAAGSEALFNLPVDALVTLSITDLDNVQHPPGDAKVKIARLYHDSITLEFDASSAELAPLYAKAITDAQAADSDSATDPAPPATNGQAATASTAKAAAPSAVATFAATGAPSKTIAASAEYQDGGVRYLSRGFNR